MKNCGKLITFGNGGSAADAQHFAAELSGRFMKERRSFSLVALSTNTSSITAIGNDYSFSEIFSRQIGGLCSEKDFVVGISTSGNSKNVVERCIRVDSDVTPIIQEVHIAIIHMICYSFDEMLE
ncbi:MAG: SIS domain-containing protein [Thermoplasmatales archaeon]|nr:SIS domain-containing protein [Thermoplasmatales archaeon]